MNSFSLRVGPPMEGPLAKEDLTYLREGIREQKKIYIDYQSQKGMRTQQIVWSFTIGYFTTGRILVGWCEKKNDYCHFNTLAIISMKALEETYPRSRDSLFREWQALQLSKIAKKSCKKD